VLAAVPNVLRPVQFITLRVGPFSVDRIKPKCGQIGRNILLIILCLKLAVVTLSSSTALHKNELPFRNRIIYLQYLPLFSCLACSTDLSSKPRIFNCFEQNFFREFSLRAALSSVPTVNPLSPELNPICYLLALL